MIVTIVGLNPEEVESVDKACDVIHAINSHKQVSREQLLQIATLPHENGLFYSHLIKSLLKFKDNPIFSMLDLDVNKLKATYSAVEKEGNPEVSTIK